jgi:hypothetical protein
MLQCFELTSGIIEMCYLMNWGDRFTSHQYVSVYWAQLGCALRQVYPSLELTKKTWAMEATSNDIETINGMEVNFQFLIYLGRFVLNFDRETSMMF